MYREVLEYIRELGKREICHRTDREKSANVWTVLRKKYAEYMDLLWGKVKRVKEKNYSFHGTYQCVARYLTADTESGICIGIYGERSLEKKSRYCICIGTAHAFLHSKKETNEEERERLKKTENSIIVL